MSARAVKAVHEVAALVASGARTVDGNTQSTPIRLPAGAAYGFSLNLTNAASAVDDTCDVFVQTKLDGTNWVDVVHFTPILGNGADTLRFVAKITPGAAAMTMFENATALGAAAVRDLAGDEWCARWAIVTGAGTHSFTFSVTAIPM